MTRRAIFLLLLVAGATFAIPGDLNKDGTVDFDDFFLFADNFGKSGPVEADTVVKTVHDSIFVTEYDTLVITEHDTVYAIVHDTVYVEEEPGPTPTPIILQGEGNQITENIYLEARLYRLYVEKQLESYFTCFLLDGKTAEQVGPLLFNLIGGQGTQPSTAFSVQDSGEYLLKIHNTKGPWTIRIE